MVLGSYPSCGAVLAGPTLSQPLYYMLYETIINHPPKSVKTKCLGAN